MFSSRKKVTVLAALLLIPFIQVGYQYYLSVQIIAFLLILRLLNTRDFSLTVFIPASFASLLMVLPLVFLPVADLSQEALRVGRVVLCMFVILLFLSNRKQTESLEEEIAWAFFLIACAFFAVVVIQLLAASAGVLFYLPRDWYILNGETLADEVNLYYGLARPSASYGEPSYLGFVAFSLYVVVLTKFNYGVVKVVTCLVLWGTVIVSATLAGFLSMLAITAIYFRRIKINTRFFMLFLFMAAIAMLLLNEFTPEKLISRIEFLGDADLDQSTYGRMVKPFELIAYTFENYPLGVPTRLLISDIGLDVLNSVDNGVLMFIVNFGATALLLILLFLRLLWGRPIVGAYLLFAGMFNGTLFGFDKVVIIGLVIYLIGVEFRELPSTDTLDSRAKDHSKGVLGLG